MTAAQPGGADRWEPEKDGGQPRELEGKLIGYRNYSTDYGELLVMFIEADDGRSWSRRITGAALTRAVAREKPLPGEWIALRYRGRATVQSGPHAGTDFHDWQVGMPDRAPAVPDFGSLAEGEIRMQAPQAPEPDVPAEPGGELADEAPF